MEARRGPGKRGAPEVWPGVGGHDDAAEEDGDDPREAERLGGVEGGPREGKGERGLDDLGVAPLAQAQRLEEQRGGGAGEPADEGRAEEDRHEDERRLCGRRAALLGAGMVEGEHGAREDDGDGVVEDALAEDDGEDVLSHADGLEDGEDAHRVSRTHHGPEEERGEARERIAQAEQAGRVDHAAHRGAGEDCAHEGEQHCGHEMLATKAGMFRLNPAAKMIGGSSHTMKNSALNVSSRSMSSLCVSLARAAQHGPLDFGQG